MECECYHVLFLFVKVYFCTHTFQCCLLRLAYVLFSIDSDSQPRAKKQDKLYWTADEDKALIETLVELSPNTMWLGENGFRNGYRVQIGRMIKGKISTKHVESLTQYRVMREAI